MTLSGRITCWTAIQILASGLLAGGVTASAAPQHIRLSFMSDASTSVGLAWSTLSGTAEAEIEYGTAPGSYTSSAKGKVTTISATLGSVSEVTLTKLQPNTTYYHRVGGPKGGWSAEHSFRTGIYPHPLCGSFSFAYMGDSRSGGFPADKGVSDTWITVTKEALLRKPRFFMLGGDLVENGTNEKQWLDYLKVTASASSQLPIMTSLGNHEDGPVAGEGAYYNRLLHLPRASKADGGSGTEDFYYFTYGNAIVVSLSTVSFSGGAIKFKDQADWLDKVLTANPRRWRIVMLHHPIYTEQVLGLLGHPADEQGQNAALVPVFNKHHVDLVFQSHNHFYERFLASACASGGSTKPCPTSDPAKGTVYVTSGGAGAPLSFFAGFTSSVRPVAVGAYHYVMLEVAHHKLYLKAYGLTGKLLDQHTLTKSVTAPDPCAAAPDGGIAPDSGAALDSGGGADAAAGDQGAVDAPAAADSTGAQDVAAADGPTAGADATTPAPPPADQGCSCAVAASPTGTPLLLLALLLLQLRYRRNRY